MKLVQLNEDLEHLSDELKDRVAVALDDTQAQVALETDEKKKEVKKDTKPAVDVTNEVAKETNADGKAKEIFESFEDNRELFDDWHDTDGNFFDFIGLISYDAAERLHDSVLDTRTGGSYDFRGQDRIEEESAKNEEWIRHLAERNHFDGNINDLLWVCSQNGVVLEKEEFEESLKEDIIVNREETSDDIKKLKEDVEDVIIDKEEVIEEPKEFGINSAITQLIKQGWENIDQVNSYLATFESAPEGVKNALQSIIDDNMIHIGALEGLLNLNPEINIEDEEEKLELK